MKPPALSALGPFFGLPGAYRRGFCWVLKKDIPEEFLLDLQDFVRKTPIEFCSCFLSYAHRDEEFAKKLHAELLRHRVQCWMDYVRLGAGAKFEERILDAIPRYDRFLVVLSKASLDSEWVRKEIAFALHRKQYAILPVRLDEECMKSQANEFFELRAERHVADFREWRSPQSFEDQIKLLLGELRRP